MTTKRLNKYPLKEEETIWEELYRFIESISNEVRDDDMDIMAIDFWLWKIERRINILREYLENEKTK